MSTAKNNKNTTAPEYKSRYSDAVKSNLSSVPGGKKFSYDIGSDKLFAQYKDSYTKAGKTAMEDTVGNASMLTGGYANSYAVTAGQQAYDSYMSKLNDKIPELEQRAYERYRDEEDSAYKRLNTLIGLENTDYGRYRDSVADYNTNREFEYNKSKDAQAQKNWQAQFDRDKYVSDRDYNRNVLESDRKYNRDVLESDRDYNRGVYESDRKYNRDVLENDRDYNRGVYESDRKYNRDVFTDDRNYNRGVYENDRKYNRDVLENDRDYNRGVYESDRKYNRDVLENDRDYNRGVYENDRDYAQNVYDSDRNYQVKLNSSLKSAVKDEEDKADDGKFSPDDAYDFIKKYSDKIYSDEEFTEALFQLYGEKDGFYDWIEQMKIPGDIEGQTYLELLYKMHPELKPTTWNKMGLSDNERIMKNATNGGATPPHSQSFWWINQGQSKNR